MGGSDWGQVGKEKQRRPSEDTAVGDSASMQQESVRGESAAAQGK